MENLAPQKCKLSNMFQNIDYIFGLVNKNSYLDCVGYKNGEGKIAALHQNKLIKVVNIGTILRTFLRDPKLSLAKNIK